ncbi:MULTISPECIES: hypothetical protein [Auritidibacter]|uniref:Uncharacterized protein n=1 Tax=Auritidibacter ignavus TaxID=678932 RepID=A0AAJ6AJH3_9MICC|nr:MULTISPECIES: hypothetical protein [Auritidibacter]PXA82527.1 hypothetical protein DCC26_00295 [Auritidibacter sp. NML120779]AXR74097.1 hypothetical protein DCC27_007080 [Auritidibacter sp. NML130574]NIH71891.1 putative membrane protein [Auritidibacter ignavus]RMX22719.1 hypothetical protein DYI20_08340 [Auritidibacter ignavus]WGH84999.1 hypothetical protein QDX20_05700 [Auritidibacter ignavus]
MPSSSESPHTVQHASVQRAKPVRAPLWLPIVLCIGVVLVVASFISLVAIVVVYFTDIHEPPFLFFMGLYGFPIGFILVLVYLVGMIVLRRNRTSRRAHEQSEQSEYTR